MKLCARMCRISWSVSIWTSETVFSLNILEGNILSRRAQTHIISKLLSICCSAKIFFAAVTELHLL